MNYQTYLFTYRFAGVEWELEVRAASKDEAEARMKVLPFARYTGERQMCLPIMPSGLWECAKRWCNE